MSRFFNSLERMAKFIIVRYSRSIGTQQLPRVNKYKMAKIKDYISTSIFLSRFKCRKRKIPSIPESEDSLFQGFLYEHITIDLLQQEDNVIVFGNNTIEGTPDGGIDFQGYIGYTYENICVRMFGQCKSSFKPVKSKYIKAFINLLQEKKKLVEVMTGFPAYGIFAATRLPNSQNLKLFEEAPVPMSWLIVSKPDINTENPYDITGYSIDDSKRIYHNASALRLLKDLKERSTNPEFFLKNCSKKNKVFRKLHPKALLHSYLGKSKNIFEV